MGLDDQREKFLERLYDKEFSLQPSNRSFEPFRSNQEQNESWEQNFGRTWPEDFPGFGSSCYLVVEINQLEVVNLIEGIVVTAIVCQHTKAVLFLRGKVSKAMSL